MLKTGFRAFIQIPWKSGLVGPKLRYFSMLQRYQEKRSNKEYKEFLDFMTSRENFTLVEYKQFVTESLEKATKGIMSKMFGSDEQSKTDLLEARTLMNACLTSELRAPGILRNEKLQDEIEQVSQVPKEKIHKLLRTFEGFRSLHRYINIIKNEGKPFPDNFEDLTRKFRTEYIPSHEEKRAMMENRHTAQEEKRKQDQQSYIASKRLNKRIRNLPYRT